MSADASTEGEGRIPLGHDREGVPVEDSGGEAGSRDQGGAGTSQALTVAVSDEILLPTGELVARREPRAVVKAIEELRLLEDRIREAKAELIRAFKEACERAGESTLHLGDVSASVSSGWKTEYDHVELAAELRDAGLPEQRVAQLIVETVSYKVDQRVARSVAASSAAYAEILERHSWKEPAPLRVTVKR